MVKTSIVECVECLHCQHLHKQNEPTYIMISGNVYLGHEKPLLGGNLEDGHLVAQTVLCHSSKCINWLFGLSTTTVRTPQEGAYKLGGKAFESGLVGKIE